MRSCIHYRLRVLTFAKVCFVLLCTVLWNGWGPLSPASAQDNAPPTAPIQSSVPETPPDAEIHHSSAKTTLGETVYKHMCVFCHGEDGNGGGKATAYLYPWPRDFRKGVFKYRTTPSGSLPLDADIYHVISRGVPGTAMPAWGGALSEDEIWSVVQYIKKFSKRFLEEKPKPPIPVNAPPPTTPEALKLGEQLYQEMRCARCHGTDLKGGGELADQLFDIWDHRSFIYDLTNPNTIKFGFDKRDIYMILTTGIDGTPMKSYNHLTEEERWALAALIESRVDKSQHKKAAGYETDLHVVKVEGEINMDPGDKIWENIPVQEVHMVPLSARVRPIDRIQIQSVRNDDAIAFRVEWEDAVPNRTSSRHQDFKDAVALEFALGDVVLHKHGHNEPFFGMGNRGKVVNIWQWRADWQTEIETKKKLEYATNGIDLDVMIFGGEVNPVDSLNPFRDVPIEELNAEGFGTLTPQPQTKQNILGKGVWEDGRWHVVFYRTLDSLNKWDAVFRGETPVLMAFAIWDGEHQDRNGRKVVSMWQRLHVP
ncbi:MAG: nitrite oxidoreductase, gamma subunit (modular protein) [Nitrospinae bacterium CG11_big_fil_rev_8_21_14_0_20_56_8]|nr:MAG: nitrite oxidoreductase, gamma subunit (modular protein) [Nitrospinae bacterium CG11_big_fil_rev_8_21_14_0_20_56_8]